MQDYNDLAGEHLKFPLSSNKLRHTGRVCVCVCVCPCVCYCKLIHLSDRDAGGFNGGRVGVGVGVCGAQRLCVCSVVRWY